MGSPYTTWVNEIVEDISTIVASGDTDEIVSGAVSSRSKQVTVIVLRSGGPAIWLEVDEEGGDNISLYFQEGMKERLLLSLTEKQKKGLRQFAAHFI